MPQVQVSYPGVYVEPVIQPQPPTAGVPTSITAFVGRTLMGPVNAPKTIFSYGDFQRYFGGLSKDSVVSYSVQDFFNNGGGQAVIVRLWKDPAKSNTQAGPNSPPASPGGHEGPGADVQGGKQGGNQGNGASESPNGGCATISLAPPKSGNGNGGNGNGNGNGSGGSASLVLLAANPGSWSNKAQVDTTTQVYPGLSASVNLNGIDASVAQRYGVDQGHLFNLVVTYVNANLIASTETFNAVSYDSADGARYVGNVLEQGSNLVRVETSTAAPADKSTGIATGGVDSAALSAETDYTGDGKTTGIYALSKTFFNILCLPPDSPDDQTYYDSVCNPLYPTAANFCSQKYAMLIADPPPKWTSEVNLGNATSVALTDVGSFTAEEGRSAAVYFPGLIEVDPLSENQPRYSPPSGAMAGLWSQTDAIYGVWKAPAGINATIGAIQSLELAMDDDTNGILNPLGVNCLRTFPIVGNVVWGARTLRGATVLADEYGYVPVQRLLLFIEASLKQDTLWAVFEPNDESLWSSLRMQIGAFMAKLYSQGALFGDTASDAYFVKCDESTTTQQDIDLGIVNVQVGFAPVRPAEFVVITIQQVAGQSSS